MRSLIALATAVAAVVAAAPAVAAPAVEIRHAAARVTVIAEARSDIEVTVIKANPRLPLRVTRLGGDVIVDGGLLMRPHGCHFAFGKPSVMIWGLGDVGYDDLPQLVIRTPMDVRVEAGDAVFGAVGRSNTLDLDNSGCGDWVVANVAGAMHIAVSGSGDVRAGSAGPTELRISGSGNITTRDVRGGLNAATSGSGDIDAASIAGPIRARISGSGDVRVRRGVASDMDVSVAGSGDISFGGVAETLEASVAGSGDVSVAKVTGSVSRHVAGSGEVRIGS
jgi:hypothetical protein